MLAKLDQISETVWSSGSKPLANCFLLAVNHIGLAVDRTKYFVLAAIVKVTLELESLNKTFTDDPKNKKIESSLLVQVSRAKKFLKQAQEHPQQERIQKAINESSGLLEKAAAAEWKAMAKAVADAVSKLKPLALGLESGKSWKEGVKEWGLGLLKQGFHFGPIFLQVDKAHRFCKT